MTPPETRSPRVSIAAALAAGMYLGRIVAEFVAQAGPAAWRLPLAGAATAVGIGGASILARRGLRTWPLLVLWGYVLFPGISPTLAAAVGGGALVALLAANPIRAPYAWWPEAVAAFGGLGLYLATLAPGLLPADGGEFQLVGAVLGIAHPPGYPLYTLLARAFTLLPIATEAWELNLLGALTGALTLAVVARAVRRETGSAPAGLLAAGALGLSATFWAQATTTNIRALTALFTALLLALAMEWRRAPAARSLAALGLTFGLAVGHHASLGFLALPVGAYLLGTEPALLRRPRRWVAPLGAMAASLVVLAYLPVRSLMGAPFDPAPIRSVGAFLDHVLARGFGGDMLYFRSAPEVWARLGVWLQILRLQFGDAVLAAVAAAAAFLVARRWRLALLLVGTVAVNGALAVTYRAPQTVEYLLPTYAAMAVTLGCGVGLVLSRLRGPRIRSGAALVAALAVAVVAVGAGNWGSFRTLHRDDATRESAVALLEGAPPDALVLADWHRATPLWYIQQVEGLRPDVEVQYVYPEGALPNEVVWLRRIDEGLASRPVIVTNRFHAYAGSHYRFVPLGDAWLVRREPLRDLPEPIIPLDAPVGERITLLGYRLSATEAQPGDALVVRVYWRVEAELERDYSAFVQLLGPGGVVGQGDVSHRSTGYVPGEVRVDAYRIPLLLHAAPGGYRLIAGFYFPAEGGWERLPSVDGDHVALAEVTVRPAREPFPTTGPRHWAFQGGWVVTGLDVDRGVAGQARLYVHLRGAGGEPSPEPARLRATRGEAVLAEASLPVLGAGEVALVALDLPADAERVRLSLLDGAGVALRRLGPWGLPLGAGVDVRVPGGARRYVPLGGEMAYLGCSIGGGEGGVTLRPRFLALRPLVRDYAVSAGLLDPATGREVKSDGTPALGAIPTLKWLRGWRVTDPHRLLAGAPSPKEGARTVVTVYDAFTLEPLNVLDERLVRDGQGITVLGE